MTAPTPIPREVAISTLEPPPAPTPTPTPGPTPTPRPTPTPLAPPGGAVVVAASGTQRGAPGSHCWLYGNGQSTCRDHPVPVQPGALPVGRGETVTVRIDATVAPSELKIRPFQRNRTDYPQRPIDPALEVGLTIDLAPSGIWEMDLCATWRGHGEPVCWLFRFDVGA